MLVCWAQAWAPLRLRCSQADAEPNRWFKLSNRLLVIGPLVVTPRTVPSGTKLTDRSGEGCRECYRRRAVRGPNRSGEPVRGRLQAGDWPAGRRSGEIFASQ